MTEENSKFALLRFVAPENIANQIKDFYHSAHAESKVISEQIYNENYVIELAIPVKEIEDARPLALAMFENFDMYYSGHGENSNAGQSIRILFPEKKVQTLIMTVAIAYGTHTHIVERIYIETFRAYAGNFSNNEIALTKLAV